MKQLGRGHVEPFKHVLTTAHQLAAFDRTRLQQISTSIYLRPTSHSDLRDIKNHWSSRTTHIFCIEPQGDCDLEWATRTPVDGQTENMDRSST